MKRFLLLTILFCWQHLAWGVITTQVDPPTVRIGETFRLTITIEAPHADSIPDLTPLQQDFTIVGTERSMAYSNINGQKHSVNQWMVLLTPMKTGTLLIPAIRIGQQHTLASSINVTGGAKTPALPQQHNTISNDNVWLKTETTSHELYINQQTIYTVRLYNNQRLIDAEYQPPRVEDSLMIPLGETNHYQTIINNTNYAVEEQQYAVFPQKSGKITIFPPQFNAVIFDTVPRRINVKGKNSQLNVKPIPSDYKGKHWLPASQVALTEVYDQNELTLNEGSTLIRTITLQAAGVPAQLLPTLNFDSTSQFNCYPEKPDLRNSARQQEIIGRVDMKVTYLLNKPGSITIPALHIHWFNTETGKEETVSLPSRTIEVTAQESTKPTSPAILEPNKPNISTKQIDTIPANHSDRFAWWLAGLFALAWVITLTLWWLHKNNPRKFNKKRGVLKQLHDASIANEPSQAQDALLGWAALHWPNQIPLNLQQIAKLVHDTSLKKQLSLLSQALYSQEKKQNWQGEALWHAMTAYQRKKPTAKSKESGLPPINPV